MSPIATPIETAIQGLQRIKDGVQSRDWRLFVKVVDPGKVGGTPCVAVTGLLPGFDWDAGKVLLNTEHALTRLTAEDVAAIHASVKAGQSWHAYKAWEEQKLRIKELEAEVQRLKGVA